MLVSVLPFFVVDTKLVFGYNFVAPLKAVIKSCCKKSWKDNLFNQVKE